MQSPSGEIIKFCDRLKIRKHGYGISFLSILLVSLFLNTTLAFATELNPPTLNSITVDNSVIDVTLGTQTVTFTIDATDDSGIDWESSYLALDDPNSGNHEYIYGTNDNPGSFTILFDSTDEGVWKTNYIRIYDIFRNQFFSYQKSDFVSYGLIGLIVNNGLYNETFQIESTPPTINSIALDNSLIDVTSGAQTVTFTIDASDDSGIDWESSYLALDDPNGGGRYRYLYGSDSNPGIFSTTFDDSDEGVWDGKYLRIYDISNNSLLITQSSEFTSYGFSKLIVNNGFYDNQVSIPNWDFDKDGVLDALTDGILLLRYAFGLRGENLTKAAISSGSTLPPEEAEANVEQAESIADIDNNGTLDALTTACYF